MAGILKKSNSGRERCLLRPEETGQWEVWSAGDGNQKGLLEVCAAPGDAQFSPQSALALPARQMFAVPLWLATTDRALMKDMIFLQLERRGLAGGRSAGEMVFDYRVLSSTQNKTLVLAILIPASVPESLCVNLQTYEPSPRIQPLPPDELVLWREDNRLVLAVTKGTDLAYFQVLGDNSFTEEVLQEIYCITLQLEAMNVAGPIARFTLWGEFTARELSALSEALEMEGRSNPRPEPAIPSEPMDLMPAPVRRIQRNEKSGDRQKLLAAAATGVYLLFVLCMILRAGWLYMQCQGIESELKRSAGVVKELKGTAQRWDALQAAIEPATYPVEQLFRCARLLPPDGVRFTLFKSTSDGIFIQGEARDTKAAFQFHEDLEQNRDLKDYNWVMPNPKLQNNTTLFQIEGDRYGAKNN